MAEGRMTETGSDATERTQCGKDKKTKQEINARSRNFSLRDQKLNPGLGFLDLGCAQAPRC
jgi:hypothetical protein